MTNPFDRYRQFMPEDRHPSRPWWSFRAITAGRVRLVRNDGNAALIFAADEKPDKVERALAEADGSNPMPFPGLFPGQVWAFDAGRRFTIAHVDEAGLGWTVGPLPGQRQAHQAMAIPVEPERMAEAGLLLDGIGAPWAWAGWTPGASPVPRSRIVIPSAPLITHNA